MVQIILGDGDHTFDASAKEITLAAPYTALSEGQIILIRNLTTNDILYDANNRKYPISIAGAVITHTYGLVGQADADLLQVIVDIGSAAVPLHVDITSDAEVATTPNPYNVTMTTADTEYSQALPANTKILEFRCQNVGYEVRYAFVTGKVAASTVPFFVLAPGEVKTLDGLNLAAVTLYVACSTAGQKMQIEAWT